MDTKLMCWRSSTGEGEKVLHISNGSNWVHYKNHPLAVTDYSIPRGSKGYATMQALLKAGYKLINESALSANLQMYPGSV